MKGILYVLKCYNCNNKQEFIFPVDNSKKYVKDIREYSHLPAYTTIVTDNDSFFKSNLYELLKCNFCSKEELHIIDKNPSSSYEYFNYIS